MRRGDAVAGRDRDVTRCRRMPSRDRGCHAEGTVRRPRRAGGRSPSVHRPYRISTP
ncbi:hypothetical protein STXM2123_5542 [Streptomyces sp. F-3]|nr:hypothetical protein STXM2123_5542 [Streptomyces sp. F-3]